MAKKNWKDVFTFLESEGVEHEVNGEMLEFHPVSMGTLLELRAIGKPLAKALATLFTDKRNDFGSVNRQMAAPKGEGLDTEMIIEPLSVDMAKLRASQREESIEGMIEALTNDDSKKTVGKLILESIKKSDKFKDVDMPPPNEFMSTMPSNHIVAFLTGVAKANKGVLGPLAETLTGLWAKAQTKISQALNENDNDADTETSSPTKGTEETTESQSQESSAA